MSRLIITCEHGGNKVPKEWSHLFPQNCRELKTHRGYDIGSLKLAKYLAEKLSAPLFYNEYTRLLIDFNRSIGHKDLFSSFSKKLSTLDKEKIIEDYYDPYRQNIDHMIRSLSPIVHISVHSFTPSLNGKIRDVDIGLLYDPKRESEKKLAHKWKQNLPGNYRTRMNKPYLGIADGLITKFRKSYPDKSYTGIELEVNQEILTIRDKADAIEKILAQSLKQIL